MSASFDYYKIFYYVGKYKNITHAASALFLSQSTVSRGIQSLEAELGCKLFERFQHGVNLTREGEILYSRIAAACEQILLGEDEIKHTQNVVEGRIRISINDFTYYEYVLPVVEEFIEDHPSLKIDFFSSRHDDHMDIFNSLINGELDFACTAFPAPAGSTFNVTKIAEYKDTIIASSKFEFLRDKVWELSELRELPFVSLFSHDEESTYLERAFALGNQFVAPSYRVDRFSHVLPLVSSGLCLAMVPKPYFESHGNDYLFEVKLKTYLPTHSVCIVTAAGASINPAAEELIRCLKKNVKKDKTAAPKQVK